MKAYKVIFQDNAATSAIFQGYNFDGAINIERIDGKLNILSLTVLADSAPQSIIEADVIVEEYFKNPNRLLLISKPKLYKYFGNYNDN
jgi:hypothetical protein